MMQNLFPSGSASTIVGVLRIAPIDAPGAEPQHPFDLGLIAPDLTGRIIDLYEDLSKRSIDRERVHLLTGVLWLTETGVFADDPVQRPACLANIAKWATWSAPRSSLR